MSRVRTGFVALVAGAGVAAPALANDFPTQARVEYVLRCMDANGGQNYDTMYACVCTVDRLAESFSYEEFSEAETFALMRSTPGEMGGVFRDPDRARDLQKKYQEAVDAAEKTCNVRRRESVEPGKS